MLYGITLPDYEVMKQYEGKGNYAIAKYYKFPFNLFYVWKLRMMTHLMGNYKTALDFGSGPGIFTPELKKHSAKVFSFEKNQTIDPRWRFDLVVCSSVLEFCEPITLLMLRTMMNKDSELIIGSPMDTPLSRLYFKLIGDKNNRYSHVEIMENVRKYFKVGIYKEWLGLYFVCKATL